MDSHVREPRGHHRRRLESVHDGVLDRQRSDLRAESSRVPVLVQGPVPGRDEQLGSRQQHEGGLGIRPHVITLPLLRRGQCRRRRGDLRHRQQCRNSASSARRSTPALLRHSTITASVRPSAPAGPNPKVRRRNLTLVGNTPLCRHHRAPPTIFRSVVRLARRAMGNALIEGSESAVNVALGPYSVTDAGSLVAPPPRERGGFLGDACLSPTTLPPTGFVQASQPVRAGDLHPGRAEHGTAGGCNSGPLPGSHRVGYQSGTPRHAAVTLFLVTVLRGSLPPTTGNSKLSKNEATVPANIVVSNGRFDLSTCGGGNSPVA